MGVIAEGTARGAIDVRSALGDASWTVHDLIDEVAACAFESRPFAEDSVAFCEALSADLLAQGDHPEVVSLGFWLRPASIARMRETLLRDESDRLAVVPRGLAYHITPANVDTMFVYSWMLSMLVGNANIVRVSSRSTATQERLLEGIARVFEDPRFADLELGNRLVHTEHDEHIASALSAAADVRVLWGGDATVKSFRRFPIPVRAREIVFPDRHSLAIVDAQAVLSLDAAGLARLGDAFFNDAYWFDQAGCSSPRLIVWHSAADPGSTERALDRLHAAVLSALRQRGYVSETGMAINKMVFALEHAAQADGVSIDAPSNEVTWVRLRTLEGYDRRNCGGGLFFEYVSSDLTADMNRLAGPTDQTAACFGLESATLLELAKALNGRGVDRFVQMGRALEFGAEWDGLDLLAEFSKRVVVDVA